MRAEEGGTSSKGLEQREQFGWLPVSDSIFESGYLISACLVSERQAAQSKQTGSSASPQPQPVTEGVEMSDAALISSLQMPEGVLFPHPQKE